MVSVIPKPPGQNFLVVLKRLDGARRSERGSRHGAAPIKAEAGTVNLIGSGHDKAHEGRSHERLCPSGHAGDLSPGLEGLGSGGSILTGGAVIAAEVEEVGNLIVSREKALGLAGRLEALHLPLASPGRLMRILRSVV
jgi:hypothetical protein